MDHAIIIGGLDTVLLLLADLRLGLDHVPELDNIVLNLLNVGCFGNMVGARHLFNVHLEFAHIIPGDFRIYDLTLLGNLGVGGGRESN
jgi:hypothetical protein